MTAAHQTSSDGVVDGCTQPDYGAVELPSKSRKEYSYVERRAELLQLIEEAGHPAALNQTELAEQYGVSQQQISKDLDRLAEHVRVRLADRDRRALVVDQVVNRAIRGLLDEGQYRQAAKTALDYDEWITEFHDIDNLNERLARLEDTHIANRP